MGSSVSKYFDDLEDKEYWEKKKQNTSLFKRIINRIFGR